MFSSHAFWLGYGALSITPLLCYMISVYHGQTLVFLSTVSANYMFSPARWYFGLGITFFVAQQLLLQTPWSQVYDKSNSKKQDFLAVYERILLIALAIISWIPLGWVVGLHALLAGPWFLSAIHWIYCLIPLLPDYLQYLIHRLYLCACFGIIWMAIHFPISVIIDLNQESSYQSRLEILAQDPRWTNFACAEWVVLYCLIACIGILGYYKSSSK